MSINSVDRSLVADFVADRTLAIVGLGFMLEAEASMTHMPSMVETSSRRMWRHWSEMASLVSHKDVQWVSIRETSSVYHVPTDVRRVSTVIHASCPMVRMDRKWPWFWPFFHCITSVDEYIRYIGLGVQSFCATLCVVLSITIFKVRRDKVSSFVLLSIFE